MSATGALHLVLDCVDGRVRDVKMHSTRPQAARLLVGKIPQQAAMTVPLLFSVCGRAQAAAARGAVGAVLGQNAEADELAVACETMQEQLWHLLLDWPKALGLPPWQDTFVAWHGRLRDIAQERGDAAALLALMQQMLLGMTAEDWRKLASLDELQAWWRRGTGAVAVLMRALEQAESAVEKSDSAPCPLLPAWTAAQTWAECGDGFDAGFAAQPTWNGLPAETGTLTHWQDMPLVREALKSSPVLARLVAVLLDLLESGQRLLRGEYGSRLDHFSPHVDGGLALVRTARGHLMHYLRVEDGRVKDYLIVAPTEWNFHPGGAFKTALQGLRAEMAALERYARLVALSLNPCVEWKIEVRGA